jgi:hypothetical protein
LGNWEIGKLGMTHFEHASNYIAPTFWGMHLYSVGAVSIILKLLNLRSFSSGLTNNNDVFNFPISQLGPQKDPN